MVNRKIFFRVFGILAAAIILLVSVYFWLYKPEAETAPQNSSHGLEMTYQEAISANKPFVMLFYSDWCAYCVAFAPRFKNLSEIYSDKYNFIAVNTDEKENFGLARDFALDGVPALYIVDPSIDERIYLSNGLYGDLGRLREELERFLRIRAMIK